MTLRASALAAALALAGSLAGQSWAQPSAAGTARAPGSPMWLDQNWTEEQRRRYHHQSQGTLTIPIPAPWFLALQQPDPLPSAGLFSDPAYLDRYGFIPSPRDQYNPDGLPVGFARTRGSDPRDGRAIDGIGFTCAACHTGRIEYQGSSMLVDGGPAMIDLKGFGTKLALALGETYLSPTRFRRFARRALGANDNGQTRAVLRSQMKRVLDAGIGELLQNRHDSSVTEGFGRLDALNRIGNTVFGEGMGIRANNAATSAPVAFPHIWDTHWFTWVQYNSSIEQPMVRNAGEAMGVNAVVNYDGPASPRYTSTIPMNHLYDPIERSLAGDTAPHSGTRFTGLTSPQWPENVLGRIDRTLAAQGAELYRDRCQGCHLPAPGTDAFWTSNRWVQPTGSPNRLLNLPEIPITTVGTDPAQAQGLKDRTVQIPLSLGMPREMLIRTEGQNGVYSFGPALGEVVERVVYRWYDANNIPEEQRARMNGFRENGIQAPLAYKARPLNGIWATPPFLHNGSVPTIWSLLSPYAERPARFRLGARQYDPVRLGYANGGDFQLDTSKAGNRNTGHLFDTATTANGGVGIIGRPLSEQERRAVIEFLKTI
ncbi:MAG TPA: di-heme-cytochrome C peroxidase [Allosphingosinicella sp.]